MAKRINQKSVCIPKDIGCRKLYDEFMEYNFSPSSKPYQPNKLLNPKVKIALEELDNRFNCSLALFLFSHNISAYDKPAIFYRGNIITYEKLYMQVSEFICSLREMGIKKGDEIPVCVSNIPEFVCLFLAINFLGAKINIVGEWFAEDYLISIFNESSSRIIFVSDDLFSEIEEAIQKSNITQVVMFSLEDSLPSNGMGNKYNPYFEIEKDSHSFENKTLKYIDSGKNILAKQAFLEIGRNYIGKLIENVCMDDECAVTYTSGTTHPGYPKGVLHSNRSYITLSRFKDSDVSGMPAMKNMTVLAHIPTYTHMELTCAISDTLYCNCTLAMEPFYSKEFFPYSLLINKPNFVPASVGFWGNLCKLLNFDEAFKKVDLRFLMLPTVTGEAMSPGEEKFFNYTARKHKFGTDKLPFPLSPVTFSIGGGTSESSGVFVTLFKAFYEKLPTNLICNRSLGLTPHRFVDVEVLDENGDYCEIGELGLLVANSPCNMIQYTDDMSNDIVVKDKYGKSWLSLSTYSYKSDKYGRIKMKGRQNAVISLSDGKRVPYYIIEDCIMKDTKNIMSCALVQQLDGKYVCHIEPAPFSKLAQDDLIGRCSKRLAQNISSELSAMIFYRYRDNKESFPLAPSGKRDIAKLLEE